MRRIIAALVGLVVFGSSAFAQQRVIANDILDGGGTTVMNSSNHSMIIDAVTGGNLLTALSNGTGTIGAAVPASAIYNGINVSGSLRGPTGVNPTGTVFAQQLDIASVNGVSVGNSVPVVMRAINPVASQVISGTTAISASAVAAQGASTRFYMTDFSCSNSGSSATEIFFLNGNSVGALPIWSTIAPAGGGSNKSFATPVSTSANTALIISTTAATTTLRCSVSGYSGT